MTSVLYLHGFCSSPQSTKARQLAAHFAVAGRADHFICPALSPVPDEAIAQAEAALARNPAAHLVGSSLGGYYATYLAEKFARRAALINPVVPAHLQTVELIGEHRNFHTDAPFTFTARHLDALRALAPDSIDQARYLLLVEADDEVLDAQQSLAYYAGCQQSLFPGGDHSFTRFVGQIPAILAFVDQPPTPQPV